MNNPLLNDSRDVAFTENMAAANVGQLSIADTEYNPAVLSVAAVNWPLANRWNYGVKRTIDVIISTSFILLVFPWLFPLIAIAILLDSSGPVFFLQQRNKINGRLFTCIKFRSMYVNNEADILPSSENDKRITGVGRFLRKHHLDELPQLWNVFVGDMSIIGPRPYMISDNKRFEEVVRNYHCRHKVKPGIIGLAQVLGYIGTIDNAADIKERTEKDIFYVYNWSFVLDVKIALRSILIILGCIHPSS